MFDKLLAGLVLALCALMLLRLAIGERRRWRLDGWLSRRWTATRRAWSRARVQAMMLWRWRAARRSAADAAEQAIRRARGPAQRRDDNVVRPDAFRKPPNDKLH